MRSMHILAAGCLAIAAAGLSAGSAAAQDTVKIGIVAPMTGTSAAVGREVSGCGSVAGNPQSGPADPRMNGAPARLRIGPC